MLGGRPVETAAGARMPGEGGQGDSNCWKSPVDCAPRGEMLQGGAWLGAFQEVKDEGEVGLRSEEGQGDGRQHVCVIQGLGMENGGRMGAGGAGGGGDMQLHG